MQIAALALVALALPLAAVLLGRWIVGPLDRLREAAAPRPALLTSP